MKPTDILVGQVDFTLREFKKEIKRAQDSGNIPELLNTKRVLELYIRAIEKTLLDMPLSSVSARLIDTYHKRIYKFD